MTESFNKIDLATLGDSQITYHSIQHHHTAQAKLTFKFCFVFQQLCSQSTFVYRDNVACGSCVFARWQNPKLAGVAVPLLSSLIKPDRQASAQNTDAGCLASWWTGTEQ